MTSLDVQIIYELLEEGAISIEEASYYISSTVKKILAVTPQVIKKDFLENAEPGDIIVSFTAKKTLKHASAKMTAKLMATIQGSPYTSCKMVLNNGMVGGYGVVIRETVTGSVIGKVPLKQAIRARAEMCLIRVPDATKKQRQGAVKYIMDRMGMGYANLDLYKTVWNRLTNRKVLPFLNDKETDPEQIESIKEPLFCSSLISVAYYATGYKKKFNNKHPYDAWPRDFLVSNDTEKICRIEY